MAFEDEAEVIARALHHGIVEQYQRTITQRIRNAVVFGDALSSGAQQAGAGESAVAATDDFDSRALLAEENPGAAQVHQVNAWLNAEYRKYFDQGGGIDTEAYLYSGIIGGDVALGDRFLAGATLGHTFADTKSDYQVSDTPGDSISEIQSEATSIASYMAYILSETVYFDAHAGLSYIQNDTFSFGGGFLSAGENDSYSYFLGGNANYVTEMDGYTLLGFTGVSWSYVKSDEYINEAVPATDVGEFGGENSETGYVTVGGQIAYPVEKMINLTYLKFTPYAHTALDMAFQPLKRGGTTPLVDQPPAENDRFALRFGFGADAEISNGIISSVEAGATAFRTDYEDYYLNFNLRVPFSAL